MERESTPENLDAKPVPSTGCRRLLFVVLLIGVVIGIIAWRANQKVSSQEVTKILKKEPGDLYQLKKRLNWHSARYRKISIDEFKSAIHEDTASELSELLELDVGLLGLYDEQSRSEIVTVFSLNTFVDGGWFPLNSMPAQFYIFFDREWTILGWQDGHDLRADKRRLAENEEDEEEVVVVEPKKAPNVPPENIIEHFEWCGAWNAGEKEIARYEGFWKRYYHQRGYEDAIHARHVRLCAYRLAELYAKDGQLEKCLAMLKFLEREDASLAE